MKRCSKHWRCEGPKLIDRHDTICQSGAGCDDDTHWVPCPRCVLIDAVESAIDRKVADAVFGEGSTDGMLEPLLKAVIDPRRS